MAAELNLYLDASALVKRYVEEGGSDVVVRAMSEAATWMSCRLAFVEVQIPVRAKAGAAGIRAARSDWQWFEIVDVDQPLCERASELAMKHRLRTLDALHLAAGLAAADGSLTFATWDHRLHAAATAEGLETLPASLG